jgi:hypothetical protein
MTSLPIIQRELLVRSRTRSTYRLRLAVAVTGLLICSHQLMVATFVTTPAALGHSVFNEVVGAAFLLCCGAALIASDSISAERREGTLGLLFLTRVRSLDVLVGKLVSVGFTSLCALIAFVPALMLPVLAGGIAPSEAFRECLALLVTLLFALGVGLYGSAAHRDRFKATFETVVIGLLLILVPYMCHVLPFGRLLDKLCCFSPLTLVLAAKDAYGASWSYPVYRVSSTYFWVSFVAVLAVALLLLALAGIRLRRPAREDRTPAPAPTEKRKEAERAVGLYRWEPGKETSPIQWVVYRQGGVSAGIWMIGAVGLACSRWMLFALQLVGSRGNPILWLSSLPLGIAGALIGGGMIASVASRFFSGVRHTGELELLLTTPLGAATIVSEQWKVLKRFFVWPVLLLQLATLLPVLAVISDAHGGSAVLPSLIVPAAVNCVNTFLGTVAVCRLGLWFGLKSRSRSGAIISSVTLAQGTPWLLSVVMGMIPLLPDLLLLVFYGWVIVFAKRRLLRDLAGAEQRPANFASELGFSSTELEVAQ